MKRDSCTKEVVGIVPAAGFAKRLAPLPLSKEIYPIGYQQQNEGKGLRPKVACHYLFEKMRAAKIQNLYVVLRRGKWDIPDYLSNGRWMGMHLAYLITEYSFGVPFTIDEAYPFIKNDTVALGFPDIMINQKDAFVRLLKRLRKSTAHIVLGLFPIKRPEKWDMVDLDENGNIKKLVIKSEDSTLIYGWAIAVWSPVFTEFNHSFVERAKSSYGTNDFTKKDYPKKELYIGDVIQAAISEKLAVESVIFPKGKCVDIGTPADLIDATRNINYYASV